MEQYKEHKKGLIGTIIFHVILLLLLVFLGFFTPLPLPGEEGILVNFGDSENGFGDREPSPARRRPQPTKAVQQEKPQPQQEETAPPVTTPPPAKSTPPKPQPAKEVAMTQDYEETAAIDAAEEKKREEERKRQQQIEDNRRKKQDEEDRLKKEEEDRIKKQQEEIDRIRREEAERVAREEAERKAQEEAALKKREEEQRKINEINSRTKGAFSNSGSGSGGTGSDKGKSQGATFPGGNQGVPTGDPNAKSYGQGGSGSGDQGSGVSYSLDGRSALSMPKPRYPGNDAGVVVVKVTVDKNGRVTGAEPGVRGTTIMDQSFWNEAKQAALKAKFNVSQTAPAFQQGTISYRFVLD
ncbi:cell envelope integrity protein TolA [Draconibacterium sp.]|nr:cell envelope integrity protein TolA [Draconibacterium sp.]